jgi:chromosome segregation ATPase
MTEQQQNEELQVLRKALGDARNRFAGLEAKIASAQRSCSDELQELQAQSAQAVERAERALATKRQELAAARERLASEREGHSEARREAKKLALLLNAAGEHETRLAARIRELSRGQKDQSELVASRDRELEESRQSIEQLEGRLKEVEGAKEEQARRMVSLKVKVKRKLDDLAGKLKAEREKNLAAEAKIEELSLEVETAMARVVELEAAKGTQAKELADLGSSLESKRKRAATARARFEELSGGPKGKARKESRPRPRKKHAGTEQNGQREARIPTRSQREPERPADHDGRSASWARRTHWASLRRWFART